MNDFAVSKYAYMIQIEPSRCHHFNHTTEWVTFWYFYFSLYKI